MKFVNRKYLLFAGFLIVLFFGSCQKDDQVTTGSRVGEYLPDFVLENENGEAIALSDFKGQIVLVEFWASWCGYCNAEVPELNALYSDYKSSGLEIIGISIDTNRDAWINKLNEHGIQYTQLNDPDGFESPLVKSYGISSIPKMYLLDENGLVLLVSTGAIKIRDYLDHHL